MAAKEPEPQQQRKWVPATVGICHWQTATDRFGPEAKAAIRDRERVALGLHPLGHEAPFLWAPETFDEENSNANSIYRHLPATQFYRNNLTALSQAFNLYFVGYQSQIFVYVPRSIARQRLPSRPDCRLRCEPSSVAPYIGGYVDRVVPHSINNLTTGFLGNEEIIVACCDDGEVYAYYTKEIAEWISSQDKSPLSLPTGLKRAKTASAKPPTHFFRENVGVTAWGLAVHRQSRLIAVSSNRREVTVFAFALENSTKRSQQAKPDDLARNGPAAFVRRRSKNWRIVLALGHHANNVPNICFIDDDEGEADKVSAIDIDGFVWIADIWNACQPVICIGPSSGSLRRSEESIGESSRGWGVLALSEDNFTTVDTPEELVGGKPRAILPATKVCSQPMADVEPCLRAIPENPCPRLDAGLDRAHNLHILLPGQNALQAIANLLGNVNGPFEDESDDEEMPDEEFDDENDGEEAEDDEDGDEEGNEEEEDDEEDYGGAPVGPADDANMDDESDVSWAGDEFIEEAVVDAVLNEASTQTDPVEEEPSQAGNTNSWTFSASNTFTSPNPVSVFREIMEGHALSKQNQTTGSSYWNDMDEDMVYFPHSGRIAPVPQETRQLARFLKRPREISDSLRASLASISKRYHLVRMYEKDFEMRTLHADGVQDSKEIGIHCPNALTFGNFHDRNLRPFFRATSRLSLVMHVPELSLVIIGSPTGRVLLLTPTRLSSPENATAGYWSHGLRVEWVLPRTSDDICHGQHRRPLHGVAIGPVQDERGVGGQGSGHASMPRRYRLMLHYRNHDIATFEITRQEQTGKLCIF
ncbi:hypothetical protein NLG97_g3778 [Lecanicillium saksenae]|uniref:Uncharacterized protein n=1 Tax=Lecanicillium saksenae TaxID=468837 RepID=A0ACC1QYV4_9HYPO|nr:hypothetical protein NLG97_g3778 [Lecanicillium saksenae]